MVGRPVRGRDKRGRKQTLLKPVDRTFRRRLVLLMLVARSPHFQGRVNDNHFLCSRLKVDIVSPVFVFNAHRPTDNARTYARTHIRTHARQTDRQHMQARTRKPTHARKETDQTTDALFVPAIQKNHNWRDSPPPHPTRPPDSHGTTKQVHEHPIPGGF